jgi:Eukaryotic aspartyl protease
MNVTMLCAHGGGGTARRQKNSPLLLLLLFACAGVTMLMLPCVVVAAAGSEPARGAAAHVVLPLELAPPRPASARRPPHHGFPAVTTLHEFHDRGYAAKARRSSSFMPETFWWKALLRWRRRLAPATTSSTDSALLLDEDLVTMTTSTRYYTADLLGGITRVGEYYTKIEVGGQKVRVQVDTGSSTLALPMAECRRCRPSDLRYNIHKSTSGIGRWIACTNELCTPDTCAAHACTRCSSRDACCSDENPLACGFKLRYGDGSYARGALMIDTLSWGNNLSAPVVFGGILRDSEDFERSLVDGILGLAYAALACNPTCVEPPFQQMVKAGVVKDKFAICMTERGGKLVLGDIDPSMAKGPITYVPLALSKIPTFYTVNLTSVVRIGNEEVALPNFRAGAIDSGTTLIAVTDLTFALILRYLQEHYCHIPHLCDAKTWFVPASCVVMSPSILALLPTLTFYLGSHREFALELAPEDYMIRDVDHGREVRCVGIMSLGRLGKETDVIFGNTIMLRYLTVYDRENKRIGFAESSGTCGSPPDCASYTKCDECAGMPDACAYNLLTKTCVPKSRDGIGIIPFPECRGSSCLCSLGPRTFLSYGLLTGFALSSLALGAIMLLLTLGSMVARRFTPRSSFDISDDEETSARDSEPQPLIDAQKR